MMVNIKYNNETNQDKGVNLKAFPSFTFSNEKYNSTVINGRRGALITNLGSWDNLQIKTTFLILSDYSKTIRTLKHWLQGTGTLYILDDETIHYDVLKIVYGEESREYFDRGTFTVTFYCYPYQFEETGNTSISTKAKKIKNTFDECLPLYEVPAGSGTISINGKAVTYTNIAEAFIIDTRLQLVYGKESGTNYTGKTKGDLVGLKFNSGLNEVSTSSTVKITPRWGWSL